LIVQQKRDMQNSTPTSHRHSSIQYPTSGGRLPVPNYLVENNLHPIADISNLIQPAGTQRVSLSRNVTSASGRTIDLDANVSHMVRRALQEPLEFPPLSAAIVPGDRVAIPIDNDVPHVSEIARGVVEAFLEAGVDAESIDIVVTDAELARLCREKIEAHRSALPNFVIHDPCDNENLCMVGLDRKKQPLTVNRTIFDADVVLPIFSWQPGGSAFSGLFPAFSAAEAINQVRTPTNVSTAADVEKNAKSADEAGWLIGALMTLVVVPGPGESVAAVIVGEPKAVAEQSDKLYRSLWSMRSPQQVSLIIATISGGAESQSWRHVGRALAAAEPLLEEGGAVAVCSNLAVEPGESLSRLIGSNDLEKAERRIANDSAPDSLPAWHIVRALQRGPVYFLSQLDPETVEELGVAPIESVDDLARLAGRHDSFAIINDAQHVIVTLE
jgi:Lactate racemase N-terminal domain